MQDSIELGSSDKSDNQRDYRHNQFQFTDVVSPKGRRLTKGVNINTTSQESLAYSNSTYHKNQLTERSPPLFNIQNFTNTQNINTLNHRSFDKKQSTFGSGKGFAIQFDKIKQESYITNFEDDQKSIHNNQSKQRIDLPCFLSNQNSPNSKFQFNNHNDSLNNQELEKSLQKESKQQNAKKYTKITPSSRKQVKESIVNNIKQKIDQKSTKTIKMTKQSKQSHEKSTASLVSNENQKRSKSPLSSLSRTSNSQYHSKNQDQISYLRQKVKELEYSLQVETISTQQLRTKVSVLNQLLQEKFLQKNGINFRLFKNSTPVTNTRIKNNERTQAIKDSRQYSNIDLYVEMKVMEKAKQQLQIQYQRVRSQLEQKNKLLKESTSRLKVFQQRQNVQRVKNEMKTQTSFLSGFSSKDQKIFERENYQQSMNPFAQKLQQLQQEQNCLYKRIQSQKNQLDMKETKIAELAQLLRQSEKKLSETCGHLKLIEQKQRRFTQIQRPRLIGQIQDLTQKFDNQRQQIERLEMENNLIHLQLEQASFRHSKLQLQQSPEGKPSILKRSQILKRQNSPFSKSGKKQCNLEEQLAKSLEKPSNPQHRNDAVPDAMSLIMLQQEQLSLLKRQRDHFRSQYESIKVLEQQNYRLRLKNEDLQNQLQSLHQLIEVDDEVTF